MKKGQIISLLSILVLGSASSAQETKLFKTLDGSVVYCNQDAQTNEFGSKQVVVELIGANNSEKAHEPSLKITVAKCQDSKWIVDTKPNHESYVAPNGATVEIEYANYEVLVLDNDEQVVTTLALNDLATAGAQTFSTSLNKNNENTQSFEILVRATRTVKSSDGYSSKEPVTFGTFRIRFVK